MGWWCLSVVRSRRCETLFAAVPPTMVAICWTRRCQRAGSSCGQFLRHSADRSTDGRRLIDVQTADSYIAALAVIVEARLCRVSFCSARPGDAYHFHTSLPCKQQDVEFRSLPTPPQLFKFKNVFLLQIFHCYPRSQHSLTIPEQLSMEQDPKAYIRRTWEHLCEFKFSLGCWIWKLSIF